MNKGGVVVKVEDSSIKSGTRCDRIIRMFDDDSSDDDECYSAFLVPLIIDRMFGSVPASLVRQIGGPHLNVGEVTVQGVSMMIESIGDLTSEDVFGDLGAGLGNVVCQVALMKKTLCVGVEVREELVVEGVKRIAMHIHSYPGLKRVSFLHRDLGLMDRTELRNLTILYSFNTLFEAGTIQAIESFACRLKRLRLLILAEPICPRHTSRCFIEFCTIWKKEKEIELPVSYKAGGKLFYIYKRHLNL